MNELIAVMKVIYAIIMRILSINTHNMEHYDCKIVIMYNTVALRSRIITHDNIFCQAHFGKDRA